MAFQPRTVIETSIEKVVKAFRGRPVQFHMPTSIEEMVGLEIIYKNDHAWGYPVRLVGVVIDYRKRGEGVFQVQVKSNESNLPHWVSEDDFVGYVGQVQS
jgi:hypothetical protein